MDQWRAISNPSHWGVTPETARLLQHWRHLVVEIKGYRREDTYWVPAVNNLRTLGRWAFAELTEIYQIDADFKAKVDSEFDAMLVRAAGASPAISA